MEQESLVITEFTDSALQPYRLKFFVVRDHLWDGNSLRNCSLFGFVPLKALDSEGLSAQRVWHSACHESESSVRASRSRAIHYKINDDVCGFHPVLYATHTKLPPKTDSEATLTKYGSLSTAFVTLPSLDSKTENNISTVAHHASLSRQQRRGRLVGRSHITTPTGSIPTGRRLPEVTLSQYNLKFTQHSKQCNIHKKKKKRLKM